MNDLKMSQNWEYAMAFVNKRRPAVLGWARPKIWSLGFEPEDFIQEAYLAAIKAMEVAERKGKPELFEQCFWVTYKFQIGRLLTDPVLLASPAPEYEKACKPEDIHQPEGEMEEALSVMSPRERKVWELLLGETDYGKCTQVKVAEMFGVSSTRIRQIRDAGLKRVRKHFSGNGSKPELKITSVTNVG